MRISRNTLRIAVGATILSCCAGSDWLHFRGSNTDSVSDETNLPVRFGEDEHVDWKVPLPGRGPSSPIVVNGRVVVTSSSGPRQDRLHVLCFRATSGRLIWHRQLWATGHTVCNPFAAIAAPTPASDGKRIFAFYGSNDLACFDLEGNLRWFRGLAYDYPHARNDVGMGSSPLVLGPTVIVQVENLGESFAAGIDAATGRTRWRLDRERRAVWTSPTVLRGRTADQDVLLLQSRSSLTAHDPQTGKLLWDYETSCHTIASLTTCGDTVYLPAEGLHALRYDPAARSVRLLWHEPRLRSDHSSPVVHDGRAYTIKPPGILVCGDLRDGSILWQMRLKGPIWATPVWADGRLYCVSHGGLVQVVELGENDRPPATSQIDPAILASPAVAHGAIYFRSDAHLWRVAFGSKQ